MVKKCTVMEEEMIGTHTQPYHCVALCLFMQESVASGRQCVAVSLELVGSLVESYQHGHSDVSNSCVGKLPVAVYHN